MKKWIIQWMVLFAAFGVRAELVASYNDGTAADAAALTNLASAASVAVTDLSAVGFEGGALITRDSFGGQGSTPAGPTAGSAAGSDWLFARSYNDTAIHNSTPVSTTDYFGFTVTASAGKMLNLETLAFDLTSIADADAATGTTYTAQVFCSVDGGAFATIGSPVSSTVDAKGWGPITSANIDLSTVTGARSVELRIGLGDEGLDSQSGAAWIQGIQLNASVEAIPEPLAFYNDGTAADADALTNLASEASVTITDLSAVGFEGGAMITRDSFGGRGSTPAGLTSGSATGSEWLFARSTKIRDVPASHYNTFGFTATADAESSLNLTNIRFDLTSVADNASATGATYTAQVFCSVGGGAFTAIGSPVSSTVDATGWGAVTSANIDLSTLAGASSVEIRIGLGDGGLDTSSGGAFVQGIQLNGTVVPKFASFNDGTAADADALTNLATVASVTVSDLNVNRVNDGNITRTEFGSPNTPAGPTAGSAASSEWLFFRSTAIAASTPTNTQDYFVFTVTADTGKTLDLTNIEFDLITRANRTSAWGHTATAQLFVAVDGGAFTSIGSSVSSTAPDQSNVWSPVTTANIDLSTVTGASSVEFRVGLGDNKNDSGAAAFVQGIQLNGTVIPEPATIGMLGLGALLTLVVRRELSKNL